MLRLRESWFRLAAPALLVLSFPGCATDGESGALSDDDDSAALVAEVCDNQVDDDGDGLVDCRDFDCVDDAACRAGHETVCDDGSDDDGDGLIDCEDVD